jgi:hypothetical protein
VLPAVLIPPAVGAGGSWLVVEKQSMNYNEQ